MKSGNPAFFAGFPSEVEKSAFGLFHGASFPQPSPRAFRFSSCSPPIIRIYDLSSVRYLVAMFTFSANHSALADGILGSCWRSFCGIHFNDAPHDIANCLQIYARPCSCALAESPCEDAALGHRGGRGRITNTPRIRSSCWNGRRGRIPVN